MVLKGLQWVSVAPTTLSHVHLLLGPSTYVPQRAKLFPALGPSYILLHLARTVLCISITSLEELSVDYSSLESHLLLSSTCWFLQSTESHLHPQRKPHESRELLFPPAYLVPSVWHIAAAQ